MRRVALLGIGISAFALGEAGLPDNAQALSCSGTSGAQRRTERPNRMWATQRQANTQADFAAPQIISGELRDTSVTAGIAPSSPTLSFKFSTGPAGFYTADFTFLSPSGKAVDLIYGSGATPSSGTYTLQVPGLIGRYAEAGTYTLTCAYIQDAANKTTNYTQSQLSAIFPGLTFAVTNKNPDVTPPTVSAGMITPTFRTSSIPPILHASINVSDTGSGVRFAAIYVTNVNEGTLEIYGPAPHPILASAKLPITFDFTGYPPLPPGSYTVTEVKVYDYAGNITDITEASTIKALFGNPTVNVVK